MIVVVVAFCALMCGILYFLLQYVRLLGGHQEQTTAIESAALAAARDFGKMVIEDENFGFVGLGDAPPVGKGTAAGDGYYLPVQSINTLIATCRLDMIVADQLNDKLMQDLAQRDYANAMLVKDKIIQTMKNALIAGGTVQDIDGNVMRPLQDAETAYRDNVIRMTGTQTATLVPGSMKLSLGIVPGLTTDEPIPQPPGYANMDNSMQDNNCYKAYVNAPYNNKDFVFAALSNHTELVDSHRFQPSISGLPYFIPTVVKCEADETFVQNQQNGAPAQRTIHAVACAEPGCLIDWRPSPGSLCVSVQGSPLPELHTLQDALYTGTWNGGPCDLFASPITDDYQPAVLVDLKLPYFSDAHPRLGAAMSLALYDWVRRCGPTLNLDSLFTALTTPLPANGDGKAVHFNKERTGIVTATTRDDGTILPSIPQQQYVAVSGMALQSTNHQNYDVLVLDTAFQPGRIKGGQHAGEPLDVSGAAPSYVVPPKVPPGIPPSLIPVPNVSFGRGSGVRPTYQNPAVSVDVIFRQRVTNR